MNIKKKIVKNDKDEKNMDFRFIKKVKIEPIKLTKNINEGKLERCQSEKKLHCLTDRIKKKENDHEKINTGRLLSKSLNFFSEKTTDTDTKMLNKSIDMKEKTTKKDDLNPPPDLIRSISEDLRNSLFLADQEDHLEMGQRKEIPTSSRYSIFKKFEETSKIIKTNPSREKQHEKLDISIHQDSPMKIRVIPVDESDNVTNYII